MSETRTLKLGDVCKVIMGQAPKGDTYNTERIGYPLIAGAGDFDKHGGVSVAKYTTKPTRLSAAGDIILSIRASIGAKVWADGEYCLGRGVAGLRPTPELDAQFLWYWLPTVEKLLLSKARGATFIQVNRKDIEDLPIELPSLENQKKFALEKHLQFLIEQKRARQRELLSELEKSVLHSLFNDFTGSYVKLGDISDIQSGITKGRKTTLATRSVPYLAVANVQAGYLKLETVKTIDATEAEIEKYRLVPGDIVITEGGDPDKLGRGTIWRAEMEEMIHQNHIFRIRLFKDSGITPILLESYLQDERARSYFMKSAKQTTGIASINKTQLQLLPVPVGIKDIDAFYNSLHRFRIERKNVS